MKACKILVILLLNFSIIINRGNAQAPTTGLLAYYPFTGNANDASGNNRNGTISGGVFLTTDRFGVANQAYSFNGSNGKITINWGILQGNSSRSMSVWFKTNVYPTTPQYFLCWGSYSTNNLSSAGTFANSNGRYLGFIGYSNDLFVLNQNQYYDNAWHNLIITFDATILKLFLDGVLVNSNTTTLNTGNSNFFIGSNVNNIEFFNGSLDEIRIYNRALTENEVQQIFLAEAPTSSISDVLKVGSDKFIHTTGIGNTFIGLRAGAFSSGQNSTFLGFRVGTTSTGINNTLLGTDAGSKSTSGSFNTFTGSQSGFSTTSGGENTFNGFYSGYSNTTGSFNSFYGRNSGAYSTTGENNTFLGFSAGFSANGNKNVMVGRDAGAWATNGNENIFIGWGAGMGIQNTPNTGSFSTYLGSLAGSKNTSGQNNVLIGWASGYENTTGSDNTALGTQAGGLTTVGSYNTNFGKLSGYDNVSGSNNTFLGAGANPYGTNKASLFNSSAIGSNAKVSINNAIVLGDFENNDLKVGIGIHNPQYRLDVKGVVNMRVGFNSPAMKVNDKDFLALDEKGFFVLPKFKIKYANENEWSDKVFDKNYKPQPIEDVAEFALKNKHLPNMPTAQEVVNNGVEIQTILSKFLEKIEEQTLYIDKISKENKALQQRVEALEKAIKK